MNSECQCPKKASWLPSFSFPPSLFFLPNSFLPSFLVHINIKVHSPQGYPDTFTENLAARKSQCDPYRVWERKDLVTLPTYSCKKPDTLGRWGPGNADGNLLCQDKHPPPSPAASLPDSWCLTPSPPIAVGRKEPPKSMISYFCLSLTWAFQQERKMSD